MEEPKKRMRAEISRRVKVLYLIFTLVAAVVLVRIGCIQFLSRETATNARHLRDALISADSVKAVRGSILSRNGEPLATSIFRMSVYFDFGSEGLDEQHGTGRKEFGRKQFAEIADTLSTLLAGYFHDKSAREYYRMMMEKYDTRLQLVNGRDTVVERPGNIFVRLFNRIVGRADSVAHIHDTIRQNRYVRLFRDIDLNEWQTLRHYPLLDLSRGMVYITERHETRVYPHGSLALRTIGRTEVASPFGIEYAYREKLQGRDGFRSQQRFASGVYHRTEREEAERGSDVVTTIDTDVQDVAAKALLDRLRSDNGAIWGTTIVMECGTGDILAMVNLTRNSAGEFVENMNHALMETLEPGSTFKLASALTLIEDSGFTLDRTYDTGHGRPVRIIPDKPRITVRDDHDCGGEIDMLKAFAASSNVWFAKAMYDAYADKPERYVAFLRSLHLDRCVGLENLGEREPKIFDPVKDRNTGLWTRDLTLIKMSYGYGVYLAPIQTLTLYNAVANGGRMVAPRIVSRIVHSDGSVEKFPTETLVNRICSEQTLVLVRKCLEEVALTGTGKEFFSETACPFRVGAKTGTAQEADGVRYEDGYKLGTMVTYFPADKPRYTALTAVYKHCRTYAEIRGVAGAKLAGPVLKSIATFLYNRDGDNLAVDGDEKSHFPEHIKGGSTADIRTVASKFSLRTAGGRGTDWGCTINGGEGEEIEIRAIGGSGFGGAESANGGKENKEGKGGGTMPDVTGMGLSDAVFILESRGAKVSFSGSGSVVEQSIAAGTRLRGGEQVRLRLK